MNTLPLDLAMLQTPTPSLTRERLQMRRLPRRGWYWAVLGVGVWAAVLGWLVSAYVQPTLRIHDEFSYLLSADTLLHGRLTNPTPPAWEALQSFHIVMHPSYVSKYPMGVGLLIAIGWLLCGTPLAGSWLGAGMLATSATWMLAGALPKRWAILGGLIVSHNPFLQLAWSQSLLHGFLPATGCALLTGGILRMRRRVEFASGLLSGCGVALLAISRPFEGLCCTLICTAWLWSAWHLHPYRNRLAMAMRACGWGAPPVVFAMILIAAHNVATTGNCFQMPYQLHEDQYGVAPLFVFSPPNLENTIAHEDLPAILHYYHSVDCLNWYLARAGWKGWVRGVYESIRMLCVLGFPFAAMIAFSGCRWTGYRVTQSLCAAISLQIAASSAVCWVYAHYLAPLIPWLLLLSLLALRLSLRSREIVWRRIARVACSGVLIVQVACVIVYADVAKKNEAQSWSRRRQDVVDELTGAGGKHLVLVRYAADHNVHQDWVYNAADPKNSSIVWARYDDGRWLDPLLKNYAIGRSVWEVAADDPLATLHPYPSTSNQNHSPPLLVP